MDFLTQLRIDSPKKDVIDQLMDLFDVPDDKWIKLGDNAAAMFSNNVKQYKLEKFEQRVFRITPISKDEVR